MGTDSYEYERRGGTVHLGDLFEARLAALLLARALHRCPEAYVAVNAGWAGSFDDVVVIMPGQPVPLLCLQLKHKGQRMSEKSLKESKRGGLPKYCESFLETFSVDDGLWLRPELRTLAPRREDARFVLFTNARVDHRSTRRPEAFLLDFLNTGDLDAIRHLDPGLAGDLDPRFARQFVIACDQAECGDVPFLLEREISRRTGIVPNLRATVGAFLARVEDHTRRSGTVAYLDARFSGWTDMWRDIAMETTLPRGLCCREDFCEEWDRRVGSVEHVQVVMEGACLQLRSCVLAGVLGEDILYARARDLAGDLRADRRSVLDLWGLLRPVLVLDVEGGPEEVPCEEGLRRAMAMRPSGLVLVTDSEDDSLALRLGIRRLEFLSVSTKDLDEDSRTDLRQIPISLQGRPSAPLGQVLSETLFDQLTAKDISKLLTRNLMLGKHSAWPLSEHYLERNLQMDVDLDWGALEKSEDIFVVEGCTKEEMERIIKDPSRRTNVILDQEFRESGVGRPVHWLYKEGDTLRWKKSSNGTKGIRGVAAPSCEEVLRVLDSARVSERRVVEAGVRRVVLCAQPGMGKSSSLALAARRAFDAFPQRWVLLWNLPDSYGRFQSLLDSSGAVTREWLEEVLSEVAGTEGGLAQKALRDALWESGGAAVFVDAFDEIVPDYCALAESALRELADAPLQVLWVATRPTAEHVTRLALGTSPFRLLPLTHTQQDQLLRSIWALDASQESPLKVSTFLLSSDASITSNPLYLNMLANVRQGRTDAPETDLDMGDLYEHFVIGTFERNFREKNKIDATNPHVKAYKQILLTEFLQIHQKCALVTILAEQAREFLSEGDLERVSGKMGEVGSGREKTGILQGAGRTVRFLHRTLAEYLAAQWLATHWNSSEGTRAATCALLLRPHHEQVRGFFDSVQSRRLPLHRKVLAGSVSGWSRPEDVEHLDPAGRSPLHLAAQAGDNLAIATMLDWKTWKGEEAPEILHTPDRLYGCSALYYAEKNGAWDCVRFLVERGARVLEDVSRVPEVKKLLGHFPPSIRAPQAFEKHWCVIACGRFLNLTLLHVAAVVNRKDLAKKFLQMGVPPRSVCRAGLTALHYASMLDHPRMAALLLKHSPGTLEETAKNSYGHTPLHYAAFRGNMSITDLLVTGGAKASDPDKFGDTPLHNALQSGETEVAEFLLQRSVEVSTRNSEGFTPLHVAAKKGYDRIAVQLLERHADPCARDLFGETPLHKALENGRETIARAILQRTMNVSTPDHNGLTPLHLAARKGYKDLVTMILVKGGRASDADVHGDTPLHVALKFRREAVAVVLIESEAPVNQANADGVVPLHLAARKGMEEVVVLLLRSGAETRVRCKKGNSPLHSAAFGGNQRVATLLAEGVDSSPQNVHGDTPLHLAASAGHLDVVRVLLERRANVEAENERGETPLKMAEVNGYPDVVELLSRYCASS